MQGKADKFHEYARQEADKYIKDNWGSMAFENLPYCDSLHKHWLKHYDHIIDNLRKE